MTRTLAVDFDGVLHSYELGWADGTIYGGWKPGAGPALFALMREFAVYIHTCRDPQQVVDWVRAQTGGNVPCTTNVPASGFWNTYGTLLVTRQKLPAFAYIDDRAIPFTSWTETLDVLGLEPPPPPITPA